MPGRPAAFGHYPRETSALESAFQHWQQIAQLSAFFEASWFRLVTSTNVRLQEEVTYSRVQPGQTSSFDGLPPAWTSPRRSGNQLPALRFRLPSHCAQSAQVIWTWSCRGVTRGLIVPDQHRTSGHKQHPSSATS